MVEVRAIIVNIKAVLRTCKVVNTSSLSAKTISRALGSLPWQAFECGLITEAQCYDELERLFSIASSELSKVLKQLHASLEPISSTLMALYQIKARLGTKLVLVANANPLTWYDMKNLASVKATFDAQFASCELGVRKPDLLYYQKLLIQLKIPAQAILYLDTSAECIAAARTFGIDGRLFRTRRGLISCIENVITDPIEKGLEYLERNAKGLHSECRGPLGNQIIKENFAQLLILEATDDPSLVTYQTFSGLWNFFQESQTITTAVFPNDMDTTSVAMSLLSNHGPEKKATAVLDFSLTNQSVDKLPLVYEDKQRPRVDMVACVHIFTMFYINGRAHEVEPTWHYICRVVFHRGYDLGSLYYKPPEYFLYALSRLSTWSRAEPELELVLPRDIRRHGFSTFAELLKVRCQEQICVSSNDALYLALKIIACLVAGINHSQLRADITQLRSLQQLDGPWPWCELYRVPSAKAGMGSPGLTTAFVIKALKLARSV